MKRTDMICKRRKLKRKEKKKEEPGKEGGRGRERETTLRESP